MIDWQRSAYIYPGSLVIPWVTRGYSGTLIPFVSEITLAASYVVPTTLAGVFAPTKDLSGSFDDKDDLEGSL